MDDERTFMQAMQAAPGDNSLRLVFADWLEERGDLRGELIRLQHKLTQSIKVPKRAKLEERMRSLVSSGVQPVGPFFTNSIGMKFAWIPAGTFMMGSPVAENRRDEYTEIQRRATLSKGFYLSINPVTQDIWKKVMGKNPSHFKGKNLPVDQVSWHSCRKFLQQMSKRYGQRYRLPTEAEWEYACRAGTTTPFYFGETISTDQANYDGSYTYDDYDYGQGKNGLLRNKTTPVGTFPPDAFGLYDMHGNVWEWCEDWTYYGQDFSADNVVDPIFINEGACRVFRGGSWVSSASGLRSAEHHLGQPSVRIRGLGFL